MAGQDLHHLKTRVRQLPPGPGVYLMKDRLGSVLYVGKAKDLRKRVATYFQDSRRKRIEQPKVSAMLGLIHDFEFIEVKNEGEALLLEGKLIKEWKPRYNTDFTDDKRFLMVRVDIENPLPRFRLVRFRQSERSVYFGPFAHSGLLRRTLAEMRVRFGVLLSDGTPLQQPDGTWILYDDVRGEIYGHENRVTEAAYRERVREACTFLEGKSREWLEELQAEMERAAAVRDYEKAAQLRDISLALKGTLDRTRKFARTPRRRDDTLPVLKELRDQLAMNALPRHIECFDVSHISGTFCVASMVRFSDGQPEKDSYRRYRIRTFIGNDDYRAMEEVVGRRYRRLHDEGRAFPDLIVIDGGRGQVGAALKSFLAQGLEPPVLIGLAKREESIVFCDGREPLQLPANNPARMLLQRIRDEAHRFANTYNAELRSQRLKETILDDFKGLGAVRRSALLNHFRTLKRLEAASVEALREVEGIGPKLAQQIYEFFRAQK